MTEQYVLLFWGKLRIMRTNNVHFVQHVTMAPRRILLVQCSQTMNYVSNVDVLQVVKWRAEKCLVVIHYYNDIAFPPNVYIHNSYSWLVQYFGANAIQPCFQFLSWRICWRELFDIRVY